MLTGFAILFSLVLALASSNPANDVKNVKTEGDQEWCDPVLGCIYVGSDWDSPARPINVMPYKRETIDTHFYLHTKENRAPHGDPQVALSADDLSTVTTSTFDPTRPTKLIIHGFIDTGNKIWLFDLAEALLNYGDYNVLRVDWGGGSLPLYYQASANCRVVGLEIGHLINTLTNKFGLDPADVHLMGHSLGAHIAGYGGEQINGLGRITGMDPAGPYFTGTASFIHLDPSDAIFVDNIHTDADSIFLLGYGTDQPFGNVDFYPNSGHDQPNCNPVSVAIDGITDEIVGTGRDLVCCSHIRAITYMQESLTNPSCNWMAHKCYDYDTFEGGSCGDCGPDNSQCAHLGIRADEYVNKEGLFQKFYLDTDGDNPYCMEHYQVSILTGNPKEAESWVMGNIRLTLYGDSGSVVEDVMITDKHQRINHGEVTHALFIDHAAVGTILRAEIEWNYNDNVYNPGTWCWALVCHKSLYVWSIEITPINTYPESAQLASTTLTCDRSGEVVEVKDKGLGEFVPVPGVCEPIEGH